MPDQTGVWEPGQKRAPDVELLRKLAALDVSGGVRLDAQLTADEISDNKGLMQLEESDYGCAESLESDELAAVARFFTLAEMQLPGWDGGKRSPVIYLVRILKARDAFTPELRKWIKANTDNRFLPHGSAL